MQPTARSTPCSASPTGTEPGGVRQVPQDERAGVVGEGRDRRQVGDRGGSVVDVAEGHERDVARMRVEDGGDVVDRRAVDRIRIEPGDLAVAIAGQALEHVPIGREVRPVGDDDPAARAARRAPRSRAGRSSTVVESQIATSSGRAPSSPVPSRSPTRRGASSQWSQPRISSPAHSSVGDPGEPLDRRERRPAERVAVEVDEIRVRDDEPAPERRQRIGRVERRRVGGRDRLDVERPPAESTSARSPSAGLVLPSPANAI